MQVSQAELLADVQKCRRDLNNDLTRLRALIPETQKPLQEAPRKMSTQVTGMSEEWGKDISRILTLSQQSTDSIDARIVELSAQNDREHERLRERIAEMTER